MCVNESWGGICREGKIPDLSQANTSYYQVHKIQPITKHHVLLLNFAIITHKPTEIFQVSCKNQSHISAYVSDDTSSLACVSDDISNPARISDDISGPIRLWHVSPIRLHHVSLTHPQTPINRSLPKAFQKDLERAEAEELEKIKIEKSRSFVGTKPWNLQELQEFQLWIRRTFEEKLSKSSS